MLNRARGCLDCCRGQPDCTAFRHNHTVRAHALGAADNRAQIVRVGDAVQQNQERVFALFLRFRQHRLDRAVLVRRRERHHALMVLRQLVQALMFHFLHRDVRFLRHLHDFARRAGQLALLHQQLFDITTRLERLTNRVASCQHQQREFSYFLCNLVYC